MKPPILFLDIDGVLNNRGWLRLGHLKRPTDRFIPKLCEKLNTVLLATSCEIVISSSWRVNWTPEALQGFLRARGATAANVIDATPYWNTDASGIIINNFTSRGAEIQAWLNTTNNTDRVFAIVDDNSDMAHLSHRLVKTSMDRGLEDKHIEQLIRMLK